MKGQLITRSNDVEMSTTLEIHVASDIFRTAQLEERTLIKHSRRSTRLAIMGITFDQRDT